MSLWSTIVVLVSHFGPFADLHVLDTKRIGEKTEGNILLYSRRLNWQDYRSLVYHLGETKQFRLLEKLYSQDWEGAPYAAAVAAIHSPPNSAVTLCRKLPLGSERWRGAFFVLQVHPKHIVMPYVNEIVKSTDSSLRAWCYVLCNKADWDDLEEIAKRDRFDTTQIPTPFRETVGMIAGHYVEMCQLRKKRRE